MSAGLHLEALNIRAPGRVLVEDLALSLAPGRITCLIGASGCGKSSVVKYLAGILPKGLEAEGRLSLDGNPAQRPNPVIAYQPQSDALLPWLTVLENAALGLEVKGTPKREARARAGALFESFGLAGCERQFPDQLSGGMRQRAAFLRTAVQDCPYLLLDEPFSALDAVTRLRMQHWLLARLEEAPRGVLLVTHDLHEASAMADEILVMGAASGSGKILARLTPDKTRTARSEADLAPLRHHLKTLLLEDTR